MKQIKTCIFIALAMVAALTMVSCKNNKKAKEPSQEEVQEMKQALADTVLAQIDELAERYWNAQEESSMFINMQLTENEIMVKPDYLLDPKAVDTLITRSQKINALAMLVMDIAVYKVYDMPYDALREAAIKLAVDLNIPFDSEYSTGDEPVSEKIKATYKACRERGDVSLFWQFEHALVFEGIYILAQNPELFLSKITEEQWQAWAVVKQTRRAAIKELAKYDEEMAQVWEFRNKKFKITASEEEGDRVDRSIEFAKQFYIDNKDKYAIKRNALLQ